MNTRPTSPELCVVQSDGDLTAAASAHWRRHMPDGTTLQSVEATRADFEAEYAWIYPVSTLLAGGNKFQRDDSGEYEDTAVQVGWKMWRAAMERNDSQPKEPT